MLRHKARILPVRTAKIRHEERQAIPPRPDGKGETRTGKVPPNRPESTRERTQSLNLGI